eukprot:scaffold5124_cov92-Skeletonema_dohrnii-CCMP3373.AAC.1
MRLIAYTSPKRYVNTTGVRDLNIPRLRMDIFAVGIQLKGGRLSLVLFQDYGEYDSLLLDIGELNESMNGSNVLLEEYGEQFEYGSLRHDVILTLISDQRRLFCTSDLLLDTDIICCVPYPHDTKIRSVVYIWCTGDVLLPVLSTTVHKILSSVSYAHMLVDFGEYYFFDFGEYYSFFHHLPSTAIMLKRKDKIERSGLIGVESVLYDDEYGESHTSDHGPSLWSGFHNDQRRGFSAVDLLLDPDIIHHVTHPQDMTLGLRSVVCIWHHADDIILLVATGTTVHKMLLSTHKLCYLDIEEHSFFVRLSSTMPLQLTADTLEWRMSKNWNTSRHLNFLTQHYAFLLDNQLQVQSNARLHAEWGEIVPLAIVSIDVISRRMRVIADKDGCVPHIGPLVVNLHVMGWNHAGDVLFKMMEDGIYLVPYPYARLHAAVVLFDGLHAAIGLFDAISTSMVANHGCVLLDPDLYASLRFTSIYALNAVDCTSSSIDCRILKILVDNARAYALFGSTTGKSIHLTGCLVDTYLGILNLHGELLCGNTDTFVLCCGRSIDGFISFHFADIDCLVIGRNHGDLVSFDCYLMRDVRQNAEHFAGIIPSFGISHNQLSTKIDSNCYRILILWSRTTSLRDIYRHLRFNACPHRSTPMCTIVSFENGETLPSYHRFYHTVWTLGDPSCVSCASRALNDLMSSIPELHQAYFLKRMISSVEHPVDCYMICCFINDTTSSIIDNDAAAINSATSYGRIIHLLGTSSNVQVLILREYFMRAIDWNKLISFLYGEWNTTTPRPDRVFLFTGDCSCVSCTSGTLIISMPLMNYTRRISYWIRNDYTTSTCVLLGDCYNGLCPSKGATSLFASNGADMVELNMVDNGEPIICSSLWCLRLYDSPLCVNIHPVYFAGYETHPAVQGATNMPCLYVQYHQIYTGCLFTPCSAQPHDNLESIRSRRMYQILRAFRSVVTSEHSSRGLRNQFRIHDQVVLYNYDQLDQVQVTTKFQCKTDMSHTDDSYGSSFGTHPPCIVQAIMILCGIASHLDLQAIINRLFNWGEIWGAMFFNVLEKRIVQVGEYYISAGSDMLVRYRYVT